MPDIKITVANKRATAEDAPVIVCGNSDYQVTFTFDDEWAGRKEKIARFVYRKDGVPKHTDVPFTDNTCGIPILKGITKVSVGVYAEELATTTGAEIPCEPSILCGSGAEELDLFALGKQAAYDTFWDDYQQKGARSSYIYAFARNWPSSQYNPKYPINCNTASNAALQIYGYNTGITDTKVPIIINSGVQMDSTFVGCTKLKRIASLVFEEGATCKSNTFQNCTALEDITFEGVVSEEINLQWSEKLTGESLRSLALALKNLEGTEDEFNKEVLFADSVKGNLYSVFFDDEKYADSEWYGLSVEDVIGMKCWNY